MTTLDIELAEFAPVAQAMAARSGLEFMLICDGGRSYWNFSDDEGTAWAVVRDAQDPARWAVTRLSDDEGAAVLGEGLDLLAAVGLVGSH